MPEFGIHLIHILDHPNQINCMLRPLIKAEAKFFSYWSRILFLLFAVKIRRRQFCIVQHKGPVIIYVGGGGGGGGWGGGVG